MSALSRQCILAAGLVAGAVASPLSLAQDRTPASESVEPPGGQMTTVSEREQVPRIDQLASSASAGTPQLAPAGAGAAPTNQVYRGGPTAEPAAPLSKPAEGHDAALVRLGGSDRCDEAKAADTKLCESAIEKRAADFEPPARPVLSPEQRLLVDQWLRAGPRTVASAAERIGDNEIDANSPGAQGLASIVLAKPGDASQRSGQNIDLQDPAAADAAGAALIQAIVEHIQAVPR